MEMTMASGSLLMLSIFKILELGIGFYDYLFTCYYCFSLRNLLNLFLAKWNLWRTGTATRSGNPRAVETCPLEKLSNGGICMEEMKIVMDRLGIACEEEEGDDRDVENWNIEVSEFSRILLDEEPSLLEIKQVFEVFDENKDGFVDATELQRVLCGLCMKEGSELEECRRMVLAYDGNGDGLLDFEDFVALMDKCFSADEC